jgi:uncharacterized protein YjbJ (UPF0337 family)
MRALADNSIHARRTGAAPSTREGVTMNWDRIEGNWKQLKGKAKEQWGKLTDDQLDVIGGREDQLIGKVQEAYGIGRDEAQKQVEAFADRYYDSLGDTATTTSPTGRASNL